MNQPIEGKPGRYWHDLEDGRIQCDVCPRHCKLHEGQRGLCFVRGRQGDQMMLTTYGRSSGFCIDPIALQHQRCILFQDQNENQTSYFGTSRKLHGCVPGFLRIFKSSTRLYLRSGF
jgi:hypothetical protein